MTRFYLVLFFLLIFLFPQIAECDDGNQVKTPVGLISAGYGRIFDYNDFYEIERSTYQVEFYRKPLPLVIEWQSRYIKGSLHLTRIWIGAGFPRKSNTPDDYTAFRLGVTAYTYEYSTNYSVVPLGINSTFDDREEGFDKGYPVIGLHRYKLLGDKFSLRGSFYVNPFAYLSTWSDWIVLMMDDSVSDADAPRREGYLSTYVTGVQFCLGYEIYNPLMVELGLSHYDMAEYFGGLELFFRLTIVFSEF